MATLLLKSMVIKDPPPLPWGRRASAIRITVCKISDTCDNFCLASNGVGELYYTVLLIDSFTID